MTDTPDDPAVKMAFQDRSLCLPIVAIQPLREISAPSGKA
jgi:hypothetical protein